MQQVHLASRILQVFCMLCSAQDYGEVEVRVRRVCSESRVVRIECVWFRHETDFSVLKVSLDRETREINHLLIDSGIDRRVLGTLVKSLPSFQPAIDASPK